MEVDQMDSLPQADSGVAMSVDGSMDTQDAQSQQANRSSSVS